MGNIVSSDTPLATVKREGPDWIAYITQPWFRYLVGSGPDGNGTTGEVLHGASDGAPTWGPVDLTVDVVGELPFANGGLGDVTLEANAIVVGGGAAAPPSTLPIGAAGQVLHANPTGAPTWSAVKLDNLSGEVSGVLPIANGGTGTVEATGTGTVVLADNATLVNATLQFPVLTMPVTLGGNTAGFVLQATDPLVVSVGAAAAVVLPQDYTLFFIAHDKTSGGCGVGVMDRTGVSMLLGITGVTFTRVAGSGLAAQVVSGASPRSLALFAFGIGPV